MSFDPGSCETQRNRRALHLVATAPIAVHTACTRTVRRGQRTGVGGRRFKYESAPFGSSSNGVRKYIAYYNRVPVALAVRLGR